ncbi:MAG: PAS domain S-box protein [Oligoflexia bacterium]|nr:PAS domain S-box protein [Oligoflexia bacterium]
MAQKEINKLFNEGHHLLKEVEKMAAIGGWELDARTLQVQWTEEVYNICEVDIATYRPIFSTVLDFYAPKSKPMIERVIKRAIDYGEPFDVELEFITAKGNHRFVHVVGKAKQENGKTEKVFGIFQDISDRKQLEEERNIAATSLDPFITINKEGKIINVNAATEKITGITKEKLINTDFANHFSDPEAAQAGYLQAKTEGIIRNYPLTIRHISGVTFDVILNASLYRNEQGEDVAVFALLRDVSELNRAKTEILKLNNELQDHVLKLQISNKDLDAFCYSIWV